MKTRLNAFLIFFALCIALPIHAQSEADEAKIRAIAAQWERAWNTHDIKALAALFTDDADFVNVGARHWKGRQAIESEHTARLSQFMESAWTTNDVKIQFLKPDIALVHVAWGIKGDKDPDGMPRQPREGVFTWVAVKEAQAWHLRAAQNTNRGSLVPPAAK